MNNIPFQVFAWVASVAYALEVVGTKLLSKHEIKNPWLFNFAYSLLVLILTTPLAIYYGGGFPPSWTNIIWAGIFWALGCIFYILALYRLDITTLSPLFNLRAVFAIILGGLLLREFLSMTQFIFIILIIVGGIMVTLDEKISFRSILSTGVAFSILFGLTFTIWAVFINKAIAGSDFWTATLWMLIISQVLFCFTLPWFMNEVKDINRKQGMFIFFVAAFDLIGVLAANRAYQENVIISSAIINLPLSAIIAFTISLIVPKYLEKHTWQVYVIRFVGIALIVWAGIELK